MCWKNGGDPNLAYVIYCGGAPDGKPAKKTRLATVHGFCEQLSAHDRSQRDTGPASKFTNSVADRTEPHVR